jgi:dihydrofolate synthase/folylpolyglutamate synthase
MTYDDALSFIHGIPRFGKKPGLKRIQELLRRVGEPQEKLRFVHVAGTNGKGSTCTMLSNVLQAAGYRTGLYISPFVLEFPERMQLNGRMIPKGELAELTELVRGHWLRMEAEGMPPNEFEVIIAIAFLFFARHACDIVVLEVGMGGRFDSTNVISTPLCSVITSIGMDHMQHLGDTVEAITMEKCGIIKPGGVTVASPGQPPEALAVIMERCAEAGNSLLQPQSAEILSMGLEGSRIRYRGMELYIPLMGRHQIDNALTVVEACLALQSSPCPVTWQAIISGIGGTSFPCRLERFGGQPLILIDGAHNEPGARVLGEALRLLEGRRIHAVAGVSADKDADAIFSLVLPHCGDVIVTAAATIFKAADPHTLLPAARRYCGDVTLTASSTEALRAAYAKCGPEEVLLVFGSLYFASELRPLAMELAR